MEVITIKPKNEKQLKALKEFLKAFEIPFKKEDIEEDSYNPDFVKKIKEAEQQIKEGKFTRIKDEKELNEFLNDL